VKKLGVVHNTDEIVLKDTTVTLTSKIQGLGKIVTNSASGVDIGASGSPATIVELSVETNYYNLLPLTVTATPSGLGTSETATIHVIAVLDDDSTVEIATRTTAAGSSSTETITIGDMDFTGISSGRQIRTIRVTAESSATSTSATLDATVAALEM